MNGQAGVLQKEGWILVNKGVRASLRHPCPIKQADLHCYSDLNGRETGFGPEGIAMCSLPLPHTYDLSPPFSSKPTGPLAPGPPNLVHSLPSHLGCGVDPHSTHHVNPIPWASHVGLPGRLANTREHRSQKSDFSPFVYIAQGTVPAYIQLLELNPLNALRIE